MESNFGKIVLPIDLGEYHKSYAGRYLQVWVNPPLGKKHELEELMVELPKIKKRMLASLDDSAGPESPVWPEYRAELKRLIQKSLAGLAEVWSQHEDAESHWSVTEVRAVYDTDPAFFSWMHLRTAELLDMFLRGAFLQKHPAYQKIVS